MASRQTTSKAAQGLLPQLEAAISHLNDEIQQIRGGQKDQNLHDLIADPLPRDQFRGLLQVWKLPPVPVELSNLFLQLEELKDTETKEKECLEQQKREQEEDEQKEEKRRKKEEEEKEAAAAAQAAKEKQVEEKARESSAERQDEALEEKSEGGVETIEEEEAKKEAEGGGSPTVAVSDATNDAGTGGNDAPTPEASKWNATKTPISSMDALAEAAANVQAADTSASTNEPAAAQTTTPPPVVSPQEIASPAESQNVVSPTPPATSVHVEVSREAVSATASPAAAAAPVVTVVPSKADAAREIALVNLRALRRSMMLDVLSKIVSVAKSKGVDPGMFSSRGAAASADHAAAFVDLEMIQHEVSKGGICEWEHFAKQVYLFCQHVIAESEKQDRQDAKQKGVELLHFAKTLTETLRKASLKKEETIMKTTPTTTPTATPVGTTRPGPVVVTNPQPTAPPVAPTTASARPSVEVPEPAAAASNSSTPSKSTAGTTPDASVAGADGSPTSGAPSESVTTPHRVSARLRQRENSVTDSPSPQRRRTNRAAEDEQTDAAVEVRKRKRPRSTAAAAGEDHSASESQMSTSEQATASGGDTDAKPRTRKRRPILPATRASSRQQKRRAAKAAAAAAKDDDDEAQDTKEDESDEQEDAATEENDEDGDSDSAKSVPVTKTGRPRKRTGRKQRK